MAYDGDSHSFRPVGARSHTPEEPYQGLAATLETVFGYSQETGRCIASKLFPWTDGRPVGILESASLIGATWFPILDHSGVLGAADPTDEVFAILAFRANFGAPTRARMRLTVGTDVSEVTDVTTPDESGNALFCAGDRDNLTQRTMVCSLDTTAIDFTLGPRLAVELSLYGYILPEWLLIFRRAG